MKPGCGGGARQRATVAARRTAKAAACGTADGSLMGLKLRFKCAVLLVCAAALLFFSLRPC